MFYVITRYSGAKVMSNRIVKQKPAAAREIINCCLEMIEANGGRDTRRGWAIYADVTMYATRIKDGVAAICKLPMSRELRMFYDKPEYGRVVIKSTKAIPPEGMTAEGTLEGAE